MANSGTANALRRPALTLISSSRSTSTSSSRFFARSARSPRRKQAPPRTRPSWSPPRLGRLANRVSATTPDGVDQRRWRRRLRDELDVSELRLDRCFAEARCGYDDDRNVSQVVFLQL